MLPMDGTLCVTLVVVNRTPIIRRANDNDETAGIGTV